MQDLETDDDEESEPFVPGDIFQTHSVRGRTRRHEAFRLKMREYGTSPPGRSYSSADAVDRGCVGRTVTVDIPFGHARGV